MNVNNDEGPGLVTPFFEYGYSDAGMEHVRGRGICCTTTSNDRSLVSRIGGNTFTPVVAG
ncbi:MAG: hypothetical protein CM15mP71_2330 [Candidatus Poseidoniales archaeon]|nr:MAG: hypothetical protein CM15mP71_2330 [Candidatus Poseidoniales archaeon]